jgi:nicotinamidase-related amidase
MATNSSTSQRRNVTPFVNPCTTSGEEVADDDGTAPLSSSYSELKWPSEHFPLDRPTSPSTSITPSNSRDEEYTFANLPPVLEPEKTALLIVDVQPEYWSQCDAVRQDFPTFPERMAATIATARAAGVARILWVRADYRYSHSPWLKQFARIHGKNKKNFRTEVPCENLENPSEFDWEPFATPNVHSPHEIILPKTSWSSTSNTRLMEILETSNIDTVLVCGLITSVCVQHSAFGVFEAGYRTLLVHDACADRGRARHDAALALYADYMYTTVSSTDLPQLWSPVTSTTRHAVSNTAVSVNNPRGMEKEEEAKTTMTTVTSFTSLASQDVTVTSNSNSPEEEDEGITDSCSETEEYSRPIDTRVP